MKLTLIVIVIDKPRRVYKNSTTLPDNIFVNILECKLLTCDFENGLCPGWYQSKADDFDWTLHSGSTPTSYTGPSSGHGGYGEFLDDTTCGNAF
ncbi:hypothetical protein P5673_025151 [Acropora cervicornis]|uniref:MAM domain-containing protein n=1 Tax=Acropora cervicornis TaxID=6130 RepID=A0AAD9Q2L4_ACRCE|nr:hypothetical protein P5673_025151 [Acropora cervicornis]